MVIGDNGGKYFEFLRKTSMFFKSPAPDPVADIVA